MMHAFRGDLIWIRIRVRGAVAAATWLESLAVAQFTQSLLAVASGRRPLQRRLVETNFDFSSIISRL
jgi:hypothetical protein